MNIVMILPRLILVSTLNLKLEIQVQLMAKHAIDSALNKPSISSLLLVYFDFNTTNYSKKFNHNLM